MTTAVYCRVSSQRQADSHGTEAQEETIKARLARDGIEAVWYHEDGARSGRKLAGREAMARLMDDIRAGTVTRVYSFSFSRLFRSVRDAADYIALTIDKGVTTICVSDGFSIDPTSPFSKAMAQMSAVFAELSADCIRDAATAGIRARLAKGDKWGGALRIGGRGFRLYDDAQEREIAHESGSDGAVGDRHRISHDTVRRYRRKWLHAADAKPVGSAA